MLLSYIILVILTFIFFIIMFRAGYKHREKDEWREYVKQREENNEDK